MDDSFSELIFQCDPCAPFVAFLPDIPSVEITSASEAMEHSLDKAGSMERVDSQLKMTSMVQEAGQGEGIDDQSPFTAAQMWASLPANLQDELFDHLDLRQATRLTRVSSSWAEEMNQIVRRSKGIALVDNWSTIQLDKLPADGKDKAEEASGKPQISAGIPQAVPVSHLILLDKVGGIKCRQAEECEFFPRMLPSLGKITFAGLRCVGGCKAALALRSLLSSSVQNVIFQELRLTFDIADFAVSDPDVTEQVKGVYQGEITAQAKRKAEDRVVDDGEGPTMWGFFYIECPYLQVRTDSATGNWHEGMKQMLRLLDSQRLLWPYPDEQTEWLLNSLENLEGSLLETVKFFDRVWMCSDSLRAPESRAALDKLNGTSKATSDGRRLNSLDLAFLGQLLVFLDEREEIPGQKPPPYAFPHTLRFSVC